MLFSFPRFVCSSAKFLSHTHAVSFLSIHKIFLSRTILFTGLDDVSSQLEQVEQRPSRAVFRLGDTNDTSGDESDMGDPWRSLRSKSIYKKKKAREQ